MTRLACLPDHIFQFTNPGAFHPKAVGWLVECEEKAHPLSKQQSGRTDELLIWRGCPASNNIRLHWLFLTKLIWDYSTIGFHSSPKCYFFLFRSYCWESLRHSVLHTQVFWLLQILTSEMYIRQEIDPTWEIGSRLHSFRTRLKKSTLPAIFCDSN